MPIASNEELIGLCRMLVDKEVPLNAAERSLRSSQPSADALNTVVKAIRSGKDPLGDAYIALTPAEERRVLGQTYTPAALVCPMRAWGMGFHDVARVVDPGCGSGRFVLATLRDHPNARGVACDADPIATLMTKANASVLGMSDRISFETADFRTLDLSAKPGGGRTLYIGNPPYVRHHSIDPKWKDWLVDRARRFGIKASRLAGLHAHFLMAVALGARAGDVGVLVTSSEWLDVNYGNVMRALLTEVLGITSLHVIDASSLPFSNTSTTGSVFCFEVGSECTNVLVERVASAEQLNDLSGGTPVALDRLRAVARWGTITTPRPNIPTGYIQLGEIARVHRGAVTGANRVWTLAHDKTSSLPQRVLYPSVTRARELFATDGRLSDLTHLKRVVDLPPDLGVFDEAERECIELFLNEARRRGAADGYVARNRKCWWSVGLGEPAPILATYMARRPPTFVRNVARARHLNIAHGVYPVEPLTNSQLDGLATYLRSHVSLKDGRVYAGGLTKFEPKEMERLVIPAAERLDEWSEESPCP